MINPNLKSSYGQIKGGVKKLTLVKVNNVAAPPLRVGQKSRACPHFCLIPLAKFGWPHLLISSDLRFEENENVDTLEKI